MLDDGPLPLARKRLGDCVHSLADPIPVWGNGICRWSDPLYVRLRGALRGTVVRRSGARRTAPCRIDVLTLLVDVDAAVASWTPDAKGTTVERLHALASRGWRPQDCELIDDYCAQIERWVLTAADLLDRRPVVSLHVPCPRCSARFAHRRDGAGELVNVRALRVSEDGCKCSACGAFWPPERFEWSARLLGCDPLPA